VDAPLPPQAMDILGRGECRRPPLLPKKKVIYMTPLDKRDMNPLFPSHDLVLFLAIAVGPASPSEDELRGEVVGDRPPFPFPGEEPFFPRRERSPLDVRNFLLVPGLEKKEGEPCEEQNTLFFKAFSLGCFLSPLDDKKRGPTFLRTRPTVVSGDFVPSLPFSFVAQTSAFFFLFSLRRGEAMFNFSRKSIISLSLFSLRRSVFIFSLPLFFWRPKIREQGLFLPTLTQSRTATQLLSAFLTPPPFILRQST